MSFPNRVLFNATVAVTAGSFVQETAEIGERPERERKALLGVGSKTYLLGQAASAHSDMVFMFCKEIHTISLYASLTD